MMEKSGTLVIHKSWQFKLHVSSFKTVQVKTTKFNLEMYSDININETKPVKANVSYSNGNQ